MDLLALLALPTITVPVEQDGLTWHRVLFQAMLSGLGALAYLMLGTEHRRSER